MASSTAAIVIAAAYLGFALLQWGARRYSDRYPALTKLIDRARRPFRFLVGLVAAQIVSTRIAHVDGSWVDTLEHGLQIGTIVALVWLAITTCITGGRWCSRIDMASWSSGRSMWW